MTDSGAESIVDALRDGVVPPKNVLNLLVGHERFLAVVRRSLNRIAEDTSLAGTKLLVGAPGAGKSMLMAAIREIAFDERFAVSYVVVDARGDTLSDLEYFVAEVLKKLRTPEIPERECVEDVLSSWASQAIEAVEQDRSLRSPVDRVRALRQQTLERFRTANVEQPSIVNALVSYVVGSYCKDSEVLQLVKKWFYCENLTLPQLRSIGIDTRITRRTAIPALNSFVALLKAVGYHGLVLLVDEVERVMELWTDGQRQRAYETLRQLIDQQLHRCFAVLAITPDVLQDGDRGIPSYRALHRRVGEVTLGRRAANPRATGYAIPLLTESHSREILSRIIGLHERAYGWKASLSAKEIQEMAQTILSAARDRLPGEFVKQVVMQLDDRLSEAEE